MGTTSAQPPNGNDVLARVRLIVERLRPGADRDEWPAWFVLTAIQLVDRVPEVPAEAWGQRMDLLLDRLTAYAAKLGASI